MLYLSIIYIYVYYSYYSFLFTVFFIYIYILYMCYIYCAIIGPLSSSSAPARIASPGNNMTVLVSACRQNLTEGTAKL